MILDPQKHLVVQPDLIVVSMHQVLREVEVVQFADGAFESRRFFHEDEAIRSTVLPRFDRSIESILS